MPARLRLKGGHAWRHQSLVGSPVVSVNGRQNTRSRVEHISLEVLVEMGLGDLVHLLDGAIGDHAPHLAEAFVVLHHRHAGLHEHLEALADGLCVVVRAPLVATQQASLHDILRAVQEQHEVAIVAHHFLERPPVLVVPGESVDEELLLARGRHGRLQQADGDLRGHDLPVLDHVRHDVALLAAGLHVRAQQVAGGQVAEAVVADQVRTLRALARTGPAEYEHYGGLG
mmetsp:Transcript_6204/g.10769  ORF Transcript_6204/g.10769 Transcript_6204/m.10769 type:complete len:228 (+) Transcript_6204:708-1391(+)